MIETIAGLKRTKYCGQFRTQDIGAQATVFGWVQKVRNLGGLIFVDLRDRTGLVQCVFDESVDRELADKAFTVRGEYVLAVCRHGACAAGGQRPPARPATWKFWQASCAFCRRQNAAL